MCAHIHISCNGSFGSNCPVCIISFCVIRKVALHHLLCDFQNGVSLKFGIVLNQDVIQHFGKEVGSWSCRRGKRVQNSLPLRKIVLQHGHGMRDIIRINQGNECCRDGFSFLSGDLDCSDNITVFWVYHASSFR